MSNLYVDTVQPFSSGSLTLISASLQGLTNISSSQVLYYNTSSGEVYYDDAPAGGGGGCATQVDILNYDMPDPGNYFYTNVQSTGSGCQTVNTLDQYGLYYNANTNRNISPVDLQGNLIGTASFATNALSSSYALTASYAENATSVNIYNSDGTLDNNRTVSLGGNDLIFSASSGERFQIASDPVSDVLISGLPSATTSNIIYYNTSSGKLTYGATPSGSGGGGGDLYWSDGTGFAGYTGSDNLFADTGSWNYTIGNTYAYETSISASFFASVNASIGRTLRSAIIGGNNNKMQDNTGGFSGVIVTDSILMGGTNNAIYGDAEGIYIIGGNGNSAEAQGNRRSGIIGGQSNNVYGLEDSVIIGGSSNLLRSESDRSVSIGGANNTWDFVADSLLIGTYNSADYGKNFVTSLASRNFSNNMQDYNVYLGVNGSGRTFEAGTSDSVNTYIDNLNVSGSIISSGSVRGQYQTLTISSNTASMDCSISDYFTLTTVSGSTTHLNAINVNPGQTISVIVTTATGSLVTLSSNIKTILGQGYTPTEFDAATDVLTFISTPSNTLLMVPSKDFY